MFLDADTPHGSMARGRYCRAACPMNSARAQSAPIGRATRALRLAGTVSACGILHESPECGSAMRRCAQKLPKQPGARRPIRPKTLANPSEDRARPWSAAAFEKANGPTSLSKAGPKAKPTWRSPWRPAPRSTWRHRDGIPRKPPKRRSAAPAPRTWHARSHCLARRRTATS